MIKLIASDIDGTLLRNGETQLDPAIFDIIQELKQRNILFVAASGRPCDNLQRLFAPVKDEIAYIAENGPYGIYHNHVFANVTLDPKIVEGVLLEARRHPNCSVMFSGDDSIYADSQDEQFLSFITDTLKNSVRHVDDLLELKNKPCFKVAVCNLVDGNDKIEPYFKKMYDNPDSSVTVVTSGNMWVDVIPKNVSKGTALTELLNECGITPEECMAFGDQENDIEMLKLVKYGYAMDTALPSVLAINPRTTSDVIRELQKFLMK